MENKKEKEEKLLNTAYSLFTTKGIRSTSIQDIVDNAGVAKGTFYLYFKDKYDIRNRLIKKISNSLFQKAIDNLNKNYINNFEDQVIFIINYVVEELVKNKVLLQFISKDLSVSLVTDTLDKVKSPENSEETLFDFFNSKALANGKHYENPSATLYTIVELTGSTCFNSILYNKPMPIEEYKPYLYSVIRKILE